VQFNSLFAVSCSSFPPLVPSLHRLRCRSKGKRRTRSRIGTNDTKITLKLRQKVVCGHIDTLKRNESGCFPSYPKPTLFSPHFDSYPTDSAFRYYEFVPLCPFVCCFLPLLHLFISSAFHAESAEKKIKVRFGLCLWPLLFPWPFFSSFFILIFAPQLD
jgi:hypothetical protein